MNELLRSILASRSVKTEGGVERPLHSNVNSEEGQFLQAIIRKYRPRVTLEIGCAYGISSLYICEALRAVGGAKHIIIDPKQHFPHGTSPTSGWEGIGIANLKRAGYADLIEFHETTSFECLPALFACGEKIDFAFLDGQHTFDYVLVDFFHTDKILRVGGCVVFDDLHYPSIRKVARYVLSNLPYSALDQNVSVSLATQFASLPLLRKLAKLRVPDRFLGIPARNFMAVQKTADDLIGEGEGTTRRWDTHVSF
jgi:predicted O-methyltransferase YrrM